MTISKKTKNILKIAFANKIAAKEFVDVIESVTDDGNASVNSINARSGDVLLSAADVGLGSVDNTSDANKPVSTAQAAADTAARASAIQRANHTGTQLASTISDFSASADARITVQKGTANGIVPLDSLSKIPSAYLSSIAITDSFVVASQVAMLALAAQTGDVAIRSDLSKSYILQGSDPTVLSAWTELLSPGDTAIQTVNGKSGPSVALTTTDMPEGTNLYHTVARTKAAAIANAIISGVTDVAPSQDAVSVALTGKANTTLSNLVSPTSINQILNMNNNKIQGLGVPVLGTDATTKAYVDSAVSGSAGANDTLSNLSTTIPTQINRSLLPGTIDQIALGSTTQRWLSVVSKDAVVSTLRIGTTQTMPDGETFQTANIINTSSSNHFYIATREAVTGVISKEIRLQTGNTYLADSGAILLRTGMPVDSGARGVITLDGGSVDVSSKQIKNLATPTVITDAATKGYVDSAIAAVPTSANPTLSNLTSPTSVNQVLNMNSNKIAGLGAPTLTGDAATKDYVDSTVTSASATVANRTLSNLTSPTAINQVLNMSGNKVSGLGTPTLATDAATKAYVDSAAATVPTTVASYTTTTGTSNGVHSPINYNVVEVDTASRVTTGTGWRFTAAVAGNYAVTGVIHTTTGSGSLRLWKNGVNYVMLTTFTTGAPIAFSGIVPLAIGEYLDVRSDVANILQANGGNLRYNMLNICLIK